jgi:hypothetical protein
MLRSSNALNVPIGFTTRSFRTLTVVYDGPTVVAAVVLWRVQLIAVGVDLANAARFGIRVLGGGLPVALSTFGIGAPAIGDRIDVFGVGLLDLRNGDVIEFHAGTSAPGFWEIVPSGLTIEIR